MVGTYKAPPWDLFLSLHTSIHHPIYIYLSLSLSLSLSFSLFLSLSLSLSLSFVCVCVRERERERAGRRGGEHVYVSMNHHPVSCMCI